VTIAFGIEPFARLFGKKSVAVLQTFGLVGEAGILNRKLSSHDLFERRSVAIGRPNLELVFFVRTESRVVADDREKPSSASVSSNVFELGMESVEHELERRKSLLTIDDGADLEISCGGKDLLKDYCPKEVGRVHLIRVRKYSVGSLFDVSPERFPLVLLVPDVWALEKRNQQPLGHIEDRLRRLDRGLHRVLFRYESAVRRVVVWDRGRLRGLRSGDGG